MKVSAEIKHAIVMCIINFIGTVSPALSVDFVMNKSYHLINNMLFMFNSLRYRVFLLYFIILSGIFL